MAQQEGPHSLPDLVLDPAVVDQPQQLLVLVTLREEPGSGHTHSQDIGCVGVPSLAVPPFSTQSTPRCHQAQPCCPSAAGDPSEPCLRLLWVDILALCTKKWPIKITEGHCCASDPTQDSSDRHCSEQKHFKKSSVHSPAPTELWALCSLLDFPP